MLLINEQITHGNINWILLNEECAVRLVSVYGLCYRTQLISQIMCLAIQVVIHDLLNNALIYVPFMVFCNLGEECAVGEEGMQTGQLTLPAGVSRKLGLDIPFTLLQPGCRIMMVPEALLDFFDVLHEIRWCYVLAEEVKPVCKAAVDNQAFILNLEVLSHLFHILSIVCNNIPRMTPVFDLPPQL